CQVPEATDTLDGDEVAGLCSRVSEGIKNSDAGTEQWRCFFGGKFIGHGSDRLRGRNHVLRIAAIVTETGNFFISAQDKISAAASFAMKAMPAVPTDSHT